jgi:hypothetical protein
LEISHDDFVVDETIVVNFPLDHDFGRRKEIYDNTKIAAKSKSDRLPFMNNTLQKSSIGNKMAASVSSVLFVLLFIKLLEEWGKKQLKL